MRYMLLAGEASGDIHGARLMRWLKEFDPEAQFAFTGGESMLAQGGTLIRHYRDMAFMGVGDVVKNAGKIRQNFRLVTQALEQFDPQVVILIDYPGFNLRFAKIAKAHGKKVFYYISPKIWAWNKRRAKIIKRYVDRMFVIFPFEREFYAHYGYEVEYLGNPTVDEVFEYLSTPFNAEGFYRHNGLNPEKLIIALLPGSRIQEVKHILPEMIRAALTMASPEYQFAVAGMSHLPRSLYKPAFDAKVPVIWDASYDLLRIAYAGVITSGTATLEAALFGVPQVVVYKTDWWQYLIGSLFVHVEFFSLVNIILRRHVVAELLQRNLAERIESELGKILKEPSHRQKILAGYKELKQVLGEPGAARRTAKRMVELLKSEQ